MANCNKCNKMIHVDEEKNHNSKKLCEDCYIDELMPKMKKAHYDNDAEFMQRLKNAHPAHPQTFH